MVQCGLPDNVHFSKLLRERFGLRPTDARERPAILSQSQSEPSHFHTYLHDYVTKFGK